MKSVWVLANRWTWRLGYALVDQACSSVSNFLLTIMVASSIPIESFGDYAITWSISLLIEGIATSLINDPLPAISSQRRPSTRKLLATAAIWINLIFGGVTSLLIAFGAIAARSWSLELSTLLFCLAVANPFQRLLYFIRRLCYLQDRQVVAAAAAIAFSAVLLGSALGLRIMGELTAPVTVLLWGTASAAACFVGLANGISPIRATPLAAIIWLTRELWNSGRWLIGATLAYWIGNQGVLPIVAIFAGPAATGILRALQNLLTPVSQFNAAISVALVPRIADIAVNSAPRRLRHLSLYVVIIFSLVAISYSAILLIAPEMILMVVYKKMEIVTAASLLWPLSLGTIIDSVTQGIGVALYAVARMRAIFVARLFGLFVFLLGAGILGRMLGIEGVVWAIVASNAVIAIFYIFAVFYASKAAVI